MNVSIHAIRTLAGICVCLSLMGCSRRPKEILSEKEMISLMADLQLAEAYSNSRPYSSEEEFDRKELAQSVLKAHGISLEKLDTTLGWYGKNLDEYVELYAKVDKVLQKRRRSLMKDSEQQVSASGHDLWPYAKNGNLTSLSLSDGWIISLLSPEIGKGEKLIWSMHLSENADLACVLGVEYSDGSGESTTLGSSRNNRFELTLQTDTAKTVDRIYGTIRLKEKHSLPLFTDSISLEHLPFDSLEYKSARSQRRYSHPVAVVKQPKKEESEKKDSLESKNDEILKKDSIPPKSNALPLKKERKLNPSSEKIKISEDTEIRRIPG